VLNPLLRSLAAHVAKTGKQNRKVSKLSKYKYRKASRGGTLPLEIVAIFIFVMNFTGANASINIYEKLIEKGQDKFVDNDIDTNPCNFLGRRENWHAQTRAAKGKNKFYDKWWIAYDLQFLETDSSLNSDAGYPNVSIVKGWLKYNTKNLAPELGQTDVIYNRGHPYYVIQYPMIWYRKIPEEKFLVETALEYDTYPKIIRSSESSAASSLPNGRVFRWYYTSMMFLLSGGNMLQKDAGLNAQSELRPDFWPANYPSELESWDQWSIPVKTYPSSFARHLITTNFAQPHPGEIRFYAFKGHFVITYPRYRLAITSRTNWQETVVYKCTRAKREKS
jgi:hypothetical protein